MATDEELLGTVTAAVETMEDAEEATKEGRRDSQRYPYCFWYVVAAFLMKQNKPQAIQMKPKYGTHEMSGANHEHKRQKTF